MTKSTKRKRTTRKLMLEKGVRQGLNTLRRLRQDGIIRRSEYRIEIPYSKKGTIHIIPSDA